MKNKCFDLGFICKMSTFNYISFISPMSNIPFPVGLPTFNLEHLSPRLYVYMICVGYILVWFRIPILIRSIAGLTLFLMYNDKILCSLVRATLVQVLKIAKVFPACKYLFKTYPSTAWFRLMPIKGKYPTTSSQMGKN